MDKKIIVYGVGTIIIAIVVLFAFLPNSGLTRTLLPHGPNVPSSLTAITAEIKPISIMYNGTSILSASERNATIQTNFYIINPNNTTLILEFIKYDVYANGMVIGHGQIGQRYEGSWQSSDYYPLVEGTSVTLNDKTLIKNTGNYPDTWSALEKGTANISITGTAHYATKTAFSGKDYTTDFNFTNTQLLN